MQLVHLFIQIQTIVYKLFKLYMLKIYVQVFLNNYMIFHKKYIKHLLSFLKFKN